MAFCQRERGGGGGGGGEEAMEVLRYLEDVHQTLAFMDSHSLSCEDASSNLFLAKFFIFLGQVSKNVKQMEANLHLLVKHLPKISKDLVHDLAIQQLGCVPDSSLAAKSRMAFGASFCPGKNDSHRTEKCKCATSEANESKDARNSFAGFSISRREITSEPVLQVHETSKTFKNVKGGEIDRLCDGLTAFVGAASEPHSHPVPRVEMKAMERAQSTLEDFCRSYFMFHGLDDRMPQDIFKYLPILMFVESYIYQADEENEKILDPFTGILCASISDAGKSEHSVFTQINQEQSTESELEAALETSPVYKSMSPFEGLCEELANRGLMTQSIASELKSGVEYWFLERSLCKALLDGSEIQLQDVMRAAELKSFDYRVLNFLLYQLHGEQVNEAHIDFLRMSELLVEISDDLFDYEEDVLRNNFNILRMFIRMYGSEKAASMLASCICTAEEKMEVLLKNLEPSLASCYQQRCKQATMEGGSKSNNPFGSWSFPPLIVDEASYRLTFQ